RLIVSTIPFGGDDKVDRDGILKILSAIAAQGEGWVVPAGEEDSHFLKFLKAFEDLMAIQKGGGPLPVLAVPTNPTTVEPPAPGPDNFIGNREANLWARIFNVRYRIALLKLSLAMATRRSVDANGRASLVSDVLVTEMNSNLKTLALQLVGMRRTGVP